jgi:hypothetical protein
VKLVATAKSLILDGRGWDNKNRNGAYDALSPDQLLEALGSWSPIVRDRAAMALARRKDTPVAPLVKMLSSSDLSTRYGACQALAYLKSADAVPALTALLDHEDMWLRVKAAEALAATDQPAMPALPKLLEMLAKGPSENDPRGMEQRYLCFAVFGTMLKKSLEGVDRDLLAKAVAAGLRNQDGRARGAIGGIYGQLSYEEIKPLLPAIHEAIMTPAPSGEMFADGVRIAGLEVLASNHIAEGIPACAEYIRGQNKWASEKRTPELLKILVSYGANAKSAIPELRKAAEIFDSGEKDFPKRLSADKAADVRKAVAEIEAASEKPELRRIH